MAITAVILTLNEERHIRRCIESLRLLDAEIFVVDSFSMDNTVELARDLGAQVFQNVWQGLYSVQFNWALDNLPIKTEWVLRLDADEYLSPELIEEIKTKLEKLPEEVTGVSFYLRRVFMGREIRRGMPRIRMLRLFKFGKARCEQRLMDEHIELLEGRAVEFEGDFADHNLHDIGWWTAKHNGYALREAVDLLDLEYGLLGNARQETGDGEAFNAEAQRRRGKTGDGEAFNAETQRRRGKTGDGEAFNAEAQRRRGKTGDGEAFNAEAQRRRGKTGDGEAFNAETQRRREEMGGLVGQAATKRAKKMRYARLPLFWRSFAYFCYRYFLRGGFLEGKEGFLWHFLQGWWYRTLVDAKVWEIKRESGGDPRKMLELLRGKYGLKI